MADGYTRATNARRPTVVVVQAGPGIENAFGALAQAFGDSVPLLVIPGGPDQHRLGEPPEFDPLPVYKNITRWAARLNFTDRIPELARHYDGTGPISTNPRPVRGADDLAEILKLAL